MHSWNAIFFIVDGTPAFHTTTSREKDRDPGGQERGGVPSVTTLIDKERTPARGGHWPHGAMVSEALGEDEHSHPQRTA